MDNDLYQKAIHGGPMPPIDAPSSASTVTFRNMLAIPLLLYSLKFDGSHWGWNEKSCCFESGAPGYLLTGSPSPSPSFRPGDQTIAISDKTALGGYWLLVNALDGAFTAAFTTPAPPPGNASRDVKVDISCWDILDPNQIGSPPTQEDPTGATGPIIPTNSPKVVVGCGSMPLIISNTPPDVVVREQFWQLLPDSYSIAPGETREFSYTLVSGIQTTTSEQQTMEQSTNVQAGAGWGVVSASVSAALSSSSTTFHQFTVSERTTNFASETYKLPDSEKSPVMVFHWQLTDTVTIYHGQKVAAKDFASASRGSIVTATRPALFTAPAHSTDSILYDTPRSTS